MTESFDDLNLTDNLLRGIYSYGFENPSPIQGKAIPIMNEKKDLIAQAQSGTGKTGAFSIGVLNNIDVTIDSTQVIIVNPTHELANQNYNVISLDFSISILKRHLSWSSTFKFAQGSGATGLHPINK